MSPSEAILTLEPLIEAVRDGIEEVGWVLSGLQKTTSHEYAGRWEGESTRSAYLFFHREEEEEGASVEAYLDETSRNLRGTLSLVADVRSLEESPPAPRVLEDLGRIALGHLPEGYRIPVSLKLRTASAEAPVADAELEARIKLVVPRAALEAGHDAVAAVASAAVRGFQAVLADPAARRLLRLGADG